MDNFFSKYCHNKAGLKLSTTTFDLTLANKYNWKDFTNKIKSFVLFVKSVFSSKNSISSFSVVIGFQT